MLKTAEKYSGYCCWTTRGELYQLVTPQSSKLCHQKQNVFHKAAACDSPATRRVTYWLKSLHIRSGKVPDISIQGCFTANSSNTRSGAALYNIRSVPKMSSCEIRSLILCGESYDKQNYFTRLFCVSSIFRDSSILADNLINTDKNFSLSN